jgi:hypothetical protein
MLAIRNYGHYWNRQFVEWGKPGPGHGGRLRGYVLRDRKPLVIDFKEQMGIYVLFTAQREVVYVGQVGSGDQRMFARIKAHTRNDLRDRWTHFSWFGLRAFTGGGVLSEHQQPESSVKGTNSSALDEIESVLLQLFEPRLNKQGPRWGDATEEFLQYLPWEWGETERPVDFGTSFICERIDELRSRIDELGQ